MSCGLQMYVFLFDCVNFFRVFYYTMEKLTYRGGEGGALAVKTYMIK